MGGESSPPARRILIVDDDDVTRRLVGEVLQRAGFLTFEAPDAPTAVARALAEKPDLVVLDVGLGAANGYDVLAALRADGGIPVVMLTGRDAVSDRVYGLEQGADDYVVKPFSASELVARVRAVLRRVSPSAPIVFDFGDLRLDLDSREVFREGVPVLLTAREFDLLAFLASSPRRVFSHAELLREVWQSDLEWQDPATVTEHVRRIRIKLERDRNNPRWIRTVRSAGYCFEP